MLRRLTFACLWASLAVTSLAVACGGDDGVGQDLDFPDAIGEIGADAAADLDSATGSDREADAETGPDSEADSEANSEADSEAEVDSEADSETDSDAGPDLPPLPICPPDMVPVPAGPFLFGPPPLEQVVDLPDYCLDRVEVSAAHFLACVADGGCLSYDGWDLCAQVDALTPTQCRDDQLDHPANWIDWFRAEAYCTWAHKHLPTQQEWEKAARGPDGMTYPWGDDIDCADAHVERSEFFDACVGFAGLPDTLVPVESYSEVPSPYGAINLVGNVKEWVEFREDTTLPPPEDARAYAKGGAWFEGEVLILPELRDATLSPDISTQGHGFRCAADPL